MNEATLTHHLDQHSAEIRDWCDDHGIALCDPKVERAIKLCTDWILAAGCLAEPDNEAVANAFFLMARAWNEAVR